MTFTVGQRVRVAARGHAGHHRTPAYVKGKTGTVERVQPSFANPETRAYGADGLPLAPLYLVGFEQPEVWDGYPGLGSDRLYVDLFEHWLEAAP